APITAGTRRAAGQTTSSTGGSSRSRTRGLTSRRRTAPNCAHASWAAARRTTPASCSRARPRTTTGARAGATTRSSRTCAVPAGRLRAETAVVAAGAYGSPGILLRSGVAGLPVGEGLLDHVGVGFSYEPTERMREEMLAFEASAPLWMGQVTIRARSSVCPED